VVAAAWGLAGCQSAGGEQPHCASLVYSFIVIIIFLSLFCPIKLSLSQPVSFTFFMILSRISLGESRPTAAWCVAARWITPRHHETGQRMGGGESMLLSSGQLFLNITNTSSYFTVHVFILLKVVLGGKQSVLNSSSFILPSFLSKKKGLSFHTKTTVSVGILSFVHCC